MWMNQIALTHSNQYKFYFYGTYTVIAI